MLSSHNGLSFGRRVQRDQLSPRLHPDVPDRSQEENLRAIIVVPYSGGEVSILKANLTSSKYQLQRQNEE